MAIQCQHHRNNTQVVTDHPPQLSGKQPVWKCTLSWNERQWHRHIMQEQQFSTLYSDPNNFDNNCIAYLLQRCPVWHQPHALVKEIVCVGQLGLNELFKVISKLDLVFKQNSIAKKNSGCNSKKQKTQ